VIACLGIVLSLVELFTLSKSSYSKKHPAKVSQFGLFSLNVVVSAICLIILAISHGKGEVCTRAVSSSSGKFNKNYLLTGMPACSFTPDFLTLDFEAKILGIVSGSLLIFSAIPSQNLILLVEQLIRQKVN